MKKLFPIFIFLCLFCYTPLFCSFDLLYEIPLQKNVKRQSADFQNIIIKKKQTNYFTDQKSEVSFDANGNSIEIIQINAKGKTNYISKRQYDENNFLFSRVDTSHFKTENWSYSANYTNESWYGYDNVLLSNVVRVYGSDSKIIREIWRYQNMPGKRIEYTMQENNTQLSATGYYDDGKVNLHYLGIFSDQSRKTIETYYSPYGKSKTVSEYDDEERLVSFVEEDSDGNVSGKTLWTYSDDGRVLIIEKYEPRISSQRSSLSEITTVLIEKTINTYNENNLLTEKKLTDIKGKTSEVVYYQYDDSGNPVSIVKNIPKTIKGKTENYPVFQIHITYENY